MSLQIIDVGSIANDNTGEPLRDAFVKVNENFSELYTQTLGTGANLIIVGNSLEATNTNGNVELVPNGSGIIKLGNVVVDGPQIRCSPIGVLTLDTATSVNSLTVTGGFNVGGASNLGAVANVTITGGSVGYALTTDGSGTLSWSSAALITGATGAANRLAYFATTGSNISDTGANLTWNGANLLTVNGNISTGNVIAGNLTVGADKIVSANTIITIDPSSSGPGGTVIIEGNLQVTGTTTTVNSTTVEVADLNITLAKDAATAAAANGAGLTVAGAGATITYASTGDKWTFNKPIDVTGSIVGSSTLNITGNANVANLGTSGLITATGNVTGGNLVTGGALSVTGNATVGNISATNANVTAITATGNANVGNLGTAGLITATGNVTGGNLKTGGILSVTGNATVGNISATNANVTAITATGNANVGNLGAAAGVFTGNITAGNINSVSGILSVTGNANLGNLGAGAGVFTGVVTVTGNLSGGNISTLGVLNVTGNANVGNIGATAAVLAGPLSGVTTINASGNANVGNIGSQHSIHTGNGSFGNINSVSGILSVTGNANVGNIGAGAAVLAGPLSGVTTINASGNANVGNIGATNSVVTANATFGNINSVAGILSVTGNANVGNIGATAAVLAGPLSGVTTINASGNANVGNIGATRGVFTSIVGNLETTAQSNITVVGTLTGLTVSGNFNAQANVFVTSNITTGNINSVSGILSVTGNANVGNIGATAAVLAGPLSGATTINASGNANVGNLGAAAGVFTSNVSAGNISTTGVLSVTGNANVGNLGVAGLITATGNITGANITSNGNISTSNLAVTNLSNLGNVGNVRITGGSTDYVLRTDGAGNLSWVAAGLISGNVNVGTSTRLAYYATSGQSISDTGANLTWNGSNLLTVTGNISAGNLAGTITTAAQPNITSVGSLSSLTVTGNLSAGNISTTGVLSVTGNANVGNLGATNIVGTLATNAQPNITSVGNLVALNAGLTNITASTDSTSTTSGALVVAGGVGIGGNLNVGAANRAHVITGNVTITGNITVTGNQNIIGSNNVSYTDNILELHNQANSAPWTTDDGKDVGIRVHYYKGADKHAFFGWSNDAQSLEYYYDGTESGGVFSGSYGTFKGNVFHSTATTGTAPFTINSTTQVANLHAALAGSVTGNAQANITSVGTLTSLSVTGNANVGNLGATAGVFTGAITGSTTLNVTGNANVGNLGATAGVFTGAITGSTTLNVTGNANVGNLGAAAGVFTGAITGSTTLNVTGNANVGNIGATRGVFTNISGTIESGSASQTNITAVGTLSSLTVSGNITGQSNVLVTSNITAGNINSVSGILSVTGNANVGNIGSNNAVFTGTLSVTGNSTQGNITTGNTITYGQFGTPIKLRVLSDNSLSFDGSSGQLFSITDTLTGDIFSVNDITGLPSIRVDSNATVYLAEISGNVGIGNVAPAHKLSVTGTMNVSGNANVGNLGAAAGVFTGNITAGNINSVSGILSVTGNANVGNIGATRGVFTNISGTIESGSASQTNITAVGTLGSLTVSGNTSLSSVTGTTAIGGGADGSDSKLNVRGNASIGAAGTQQYLRMYTGNFAGQYFSMQFGIDGVYGANEIRGSAVDNYISLWTNTTERIRINSNGNVGIGNTVPTHTLRIEGTFSATGNANVGNLGTAGLITATGNVSGGNLTTSGLLSVTGNANVGNIGATNANLTALTVTGNASIGNISSTSATFTSNIANVTTYNLSVNNSNNSSTPGSGIGFYTINGFAGEISTVYSFGHSVFKIRTPDSWNSGNIRERYQIYSNSGGANIVQSWFRGDGTESLRLTHGGNFLIGTTTDDTTNKLQVVGGVNFGGASGLTWDNTNSRLGIGTNSPALPLDIVGSAPKLQLNRTSVSARLILENSGSAWYINSVDNNALVFSTSNLERARFHSSTGNFLIATTTDSGYKLEVANSGSSGTARFYDATATTGSTKVVVRAGAGQSSASTVDIQDANAVNIFQFIPNGDATGSRAKLISDTGGLTVTTSAALRTIFLGNDSGVPYLVGGSNFILGWTPTTNSQAATDLSLSRSSAGVLEINNGTAGTYRDLILRNITSSGNISGGNLIAGNLVLGSDALTSSNSTITIDPSTAGTGGNVIIQGNLQVTGTTTTINSTTMDVTDLNITVAKGAANPAAANGAGLTIDGAAATLTYNSTSNIWVFDRALSVSGNANVSNIGATNSVITANGTFGNINSVAGILSVTGNANVGNIGATAAVLAGPLSGVTTINASGNANVGNIGAAAGVFTGNVSVTSNITAGNINSVSGILSVTGNANVGNIGATRGVFTNISGTIESGSASQTNITAVGTLGSLTVSGNAFLSTSSGNVGVGTSTPAYKLEVNGSFAATTKSFVIDHPTQTGMKLRYGSLEGPENGVYVRGRSSSHVIDLPEYWSKLVDPASITVNITPIGQSQNIVVVAYDNQQVTLAGVEAEYFYTVNAERIDVEKLTVEFEA